jgi:hypothetical protein
MINTSILILVDQKTLCLAVNDACASESKRGQVISKTLQFMEMDYFGYFGPYRTSIHGTDKPV